MGLWILLGVVLWFGYQAFTNKAGQIAPTLEGGAWVAADAGDVPVLVDGRPAGWTVYAYFSLT